MQTAHKKKSADLGSFYLLEVLRIMKLNKYNADEDDMIAGNVRLVPLTFNSLGAVSNTTLDLVNRIAEELRMRWLYPVAKTRRFIFQQMSCLLHKHNSKLFQARFTIPEDPQSFTFLENLSVLAG